MGSSSSKFSSSTTDAQILANRSLSGVHFLITGGSSGIGLQCAKSLYKHAANITIASRTMSNMEEAKTSIESQQCDTPGQIQIIRLDLADLDSVAQFVTEFEEKNQFGKINVLMLNAGLYMDKRHETKQGFEIQFGVNHLGHYALTNRILQQDLLDEHARIVVVSSKLHGMGKMDWDDVFFEKNRKYNAWKSYGQSKLANILFAKELAKKLATTDKWKDVHVYAVHPGWIRTNFERDMNSKSFFGIIQAIGIPFQKSIEAGAATSLYCAVHEDCASETGLYYDNCTVTTPSKAAQSVEDAEKLWAFSKEKTGLDYFEGK